MKAPGGEHDHGRLDAAARRHRLERLEELARVAVDGADAVALEEHGERPLQRLAALEHVAHPRRRAQVVLQHEVLPVAVADQVDPGHVGVDPPRHVEPDHLAPEVLRAEDELRRDAACGEDALVVVDVVEEEVESADALLQAPLHARPLGGRDDARHQVEGEDPLDALLVAVHGEADPLGQERRVGDAAALLEAGGGEAGELPVQRAVVLARRPVALDHLVEERAGIVAGGERPLCRRGFQGMSLASATREVAVDSSRPALPASGADA